MLKSPKLMLSAAVVLGALCVVSCDKAENIPNESGTQGMLKLGKQLENPYSVENMKQAWNNLQENNSSYRMMGDGISTTHLYLKFKPQNEDELNLLQQDSTLNLYTYPLDHEILGEGDYYQDPETPDSLPTYQYCAVPVDKVLPGGVSYEVLAELFIPDEDPDDDEGQRFASEEVTDALVDEALRITDNLEPEETHENQRMARKWRPAGNVKVWDDEMDDYIGVHGAKVRARRWFTTRTGITNSAGNYSCSGKFRRKANYSIKWERYHFSIRSGTIGQALYNGPKKKGNWDLKIKNGKQQYYALIFQAAHFYYYGHRMGLTSPPRNSWWKRQLKIAARAKSGYSSYAKARTIYGGADISIQAYGNSSDGVFGTTIHELAHAAHRELDINAYSHLVYNAYTYPCIATRGDCMDEDLGPTANNTRRLMETWPKTVEIVLTLDWYRNKCEKQNYDYHKMNWQKVKIEERPHYTSAGYDMIDDVNQRDDHNDDSYPQDQVEGYTIKQLESALKGAKSWEEWRENIKTMYYNPTEEHLNELFANWSD